MFNSLSYYSNNVAGDFTEDPVHPKINWPSRVNCPSCVDDDGAFNREQVIQHLASVYNVKVANGDTINQYCDGVYDFQLGAKLTIDGTNARILKKRVICGSFDHV